MKYLMIISLLFLFSGCVEKQIVFKDKLICVEQLTIDRPLAQIRVHKDDIEVAKAFKESLDDSFEFYEKQVVDNNKICKGNK